MPDHDYYLGFYITGINSDLKEKAKRKEKALWQELVSNTETF